MQGCFYNSIAEKRLARYTRHSTVDAALNSKVKYFKQIVFLSEQSAVSKVITNVRSAAFRP